MKKLLFLLSTGLVFATSCLNTNNVFSTINFIAKVKSNLKTNLKTNQDKLNSLLYTNSNNEFENSLVPNSNGFELKNYNSVFLKSLAYDHSNLKLTSKLSNLMNYDFKHHVAKTDTYLDKVDYLKMNNIVSKDKKETLINHNLTFLNHFFNNQSVGFNPNGYIVSRRTLLSTNNAKPKAQGVLILKNLQKYVKTSFTQTNNNQLLQDKEVPKLSIGWSGVYFTTNHKILTNYFLNILNTSASYINAITSTFQHFAGSASLKNTNASNGFFWSSWSNERLFKYAVSYKSITQNEVSTSMVDDIEDSLSDQDLAEFTAFRQRIFYAFAEYKYQHPELGEHFTTYRRVMNKALTRYAKENLGYKNDDAQEQAFDPNYNQKRELNKIDEETAEDLEAYENGATTTEGELGADAGEIATEATGVDLPLIAQGAEATAACANVPILGIIIAIIVILVIVGITLLVKSAIDKMHDWKLNNTKIHPRGAWNLKQLWFNQKTRMFRKLTSDEIQFNGHFFKPWFGKIQFHVNATKPIDVLPKYLNKKISISPNLHKTYNLITGTNNNFNFVVDAATLKQIVASSYLPNPQYSINQVLAKNNLNLSNLNLSNQTWIKLIKQIKHPYVNRNYAAVLNFVNQKLAYCNIKANTTTNFPYQDSSYLQEMITGDKNAQDFIVNNQQITGILNDLVNVKNEWTNQVDVQTKKVIVPGIKESIQYNPDHYTSFVTWYYYHFLKPKLWVDSNTDDAINIAFLTRIFTKFRLKRTKMTFKQELNLENMNEIMDLSSRQF